MPKFICHLFVCCNRRESGGRKCCNPDGSEALRERFKGELKKRNLGPLVRANKAGCLDQCELGPTVVIYPQAIWYGGVKLEDVERIIEETVIGGRVLADLLISDDKLNAKSVGQLTDAQREELDRRLAQHKGSPNDVVPWGDVKGDAIKRRPTP